MISRPLDEQKAICVKVDFLYLAIHFYGMKRKSDTFCGFYWIKKPVETLLIFFYLTKLL